MMTSQVTSPAANVELVRAGFQAFNAGDADACLARIAPDLITNLAELPEPQHGREAWRQGFEMMRRAYVSHEFYRIAGGLIAEEWICSDTATLLRQLS
jgi:ketosteroid isomerase-like protein